MNRKTLRFWNELLGLNKGTGHTQFLRFEDCDFPFVFLLLSLHFSMDNYAFSAFR